MSSKKSSPKSLKKSPKSSPARSLKKSPIKSLKKSPKSSPARSLKASPNRSLKKSPARSSPQKIKQYKQCLVEAKTKNLKLCPQGYCSAKVNFKVFPSAYANGYASQVCSGDKSDIEGTYSNHYSSPKKTNSDLTRWYSEKWVNVCEKDETGNYKSCGRKNATLDPKKYPYCRALHKLPGTTVKTVGELTDKELKQLCKTKKSLKQGIQGVPTRIFVKNVREK